MVHEGSSPEYGEDLKLRLYPLCARDITYANALLVAKNCLPCQVKNPYNTENEEIYSMLAKTGTCNENITTYPLPLRQCGLCNHNAIDAIFATLILIALWVVFTNTWSLIVWTSNKKFKQSQIYFKMSLACSNLLFGVTVFPCVAYALYSQMYAGHPELYDFASLTNYTRTSEYYRHWTRLFTPVYMQFTGILFIVANGANICSFLLMSIDRYLALAVSLRYHKIMRKRRCLLAIVLCWLANIVVGITSLALMVNGKFKFRCEPGAMFLPLPVFTNSADALYMLVFIVPYIAVFVANIIIIFATTRSISSSSPKKKHNFLKDITSITTSCSKNMSSQTKPTEIHYNNSDVFEDSVDSVKSAGGQTRNGTTDDTVSPNNVTLPSASTPSPQNNTSTFFPRKIKRKKRRSSLQAKHNFKNVTSGRVMRMRKAPLLSNGRDRQSRASMASIMSTEHQHANRTLLCMLIVYVASTLPFVTMLGVSYTEEKNNNENNFNYNNIGMLVATCAFLLSFIINTVVYDVRSKQFRKASRVILRKVVKACTRRENF